MALQSVGVKSAAREEGVTNVWDRQKTIDALGVKARRWNRRVFYLYDFLNMCPTPRPVEVEALTS